MSSNASITGGREGSQDTRKKAQRWEIARYVYALIVVLALAGVSSAGAVIAIDGQHDRAKERTDVYNLGTILRTNRIGQEVARLQSHALAKRLPAGEAAPAVHGDHGARRKSPGIPAHLDIIGVNLGAVGVLQKEFGDPIFVNTLRRAVDTLDRIRGEVTWTLSFNPVEFDRIKLDLGLFQVAVSQLEKLHRDARATEVAALDAQQRQNTRIFLVGLSILAIFAGAAIFQTLRLIYRSVDSQARGAEALHTSEARLRGVMDNVGDAIITSDECGIIESVNAATEDLFGYSAGELLGQNISVLMEGAEGREHDGHIQRYREGGVATVMGGKPFERLGRRKDGEVLAIEVTISETMIGEKRAFIGTLRDVSERKRMEGLSARLGRILDASDNEIYVFDAETYKFVQVNQGAQRNIGYSMEEMRELTAWDIKPAVSKEEFLSIVRPLQAGALNLLKFETIHKRKAGGVYPVEVRLQLYQSETPPVFVAVIQDISERKRTEAHMNKLTADLERRVEKRTRDLQTSNSDLVLSIKSLRSTQDQLVQSEKMAALGGLVAGVAHEINTPLGVAVTAASHLMQSSEFLSRDFAANQMKKTELEGYLDSTQESTRIILGNLSRASELVKSFKQVAVDQSSDELRQFNISEYLAEILVSLRPSLKKRKVEVEFDCDETLEITGYAGAFSQVITNFVMNSLTHAFDAGVEGQISIDVSSANGQCELVYADDGKGMRKDVVAKVFEPFFTTNRANGGSGLGLNIVYNVVTEKLGGAVRCTSEPDGGTTFLVTFPVQRQAQSTPTASDGPDALRAVG